MKKNKNFFWKLFIQKIDFFFFIGFLLTFTLSIRKVLYFAPIKGAFNEYTGIYLYLSDLFLLFTILSWIVIKYNVLSNLSIVPRGTQSYTQNNINKYKYFFSYPKVIHSFNKITSTLLFHLPEMQGKKSLALKEEIRKPHLNVPRGTFSPQAGMKKLALISKRILNKISNRKIIYLPLFLITWSLLSISWSIDKNVSLFRSLKLLEFYLLYIYLIFRISPLFKYPPRQVSSEIRGALRKKFKLFHVEQFKSSFNKLDIISLILISLGFIHSIIAIIQVIAQKSLGLFWLKESLISPYIPGVAKIILDGEKYVRGYGLFPHPNILGGFLIFTIITSILHLKKIPIQKKCSTWNIPPDKHGTISTRKASFNKEGLFYLGENVPRGTFHRVGVKKFALKTFITIQVVALFLTFSKSAFLGLSFGMLIFFLLKNFFQLKKLFHVKHSMGQVWNIQQSKRGIITILLSGLIIISIFVLSKPNLDSFLLVSLKERLLFINLSPLLNCFTWNNLIMEPFYVLKLFLFGIGNGQYIPYLQENFAFLKEWQFQPIHNVYLITLTELGIIGLSLFSYFIWTVLKIIPPARNASPKKHSFQGKNSKSSSKCFTWNNFTAGERGTINEISVENLKKQNISKYFYIVLIALLFIMLFDHYLWTIQQGQILLWLILGLIVGNKLNNASLT